MRMNVWTRRKVNAYIYIYIHSLYTYMQTYTEHTKSLSLSVCVCLYSHIYMYWIQFNHVNVTQMTVLVYSFPLKFVFSHTLFHRHQRNCCWYTSWCYVFPPFYVISVVVGTVVLALVPYFPHLHVFGMLFYFSSHSLSLLLGNALCKISWSPDENFQ